MSDVLTVYASRPEATRHAEWVATGQKGPAETSVDLVIADLTPEQRELLYQAGVHGFQRWGLEAVGEPTLRSRPSGGSAEEHPDSEWYVAAYSQSLYVDELTVERVWGEVRKRISHRQRVAELERIAELHNRELAEAEREAKRRKEARETAAREAKEAEKRAWVEAHGSAHLRRCVAAGYDCQRLYVTERAAVEHPGFVLDFEQAARWRSRSCPSEAALDLAEQVKGTVVWLTAEPQAGPVAPDRDDWEAFQECEAVVIENYLGKYTLVKII